MHSRNAAKAAALVLALVVAAGLGRAQVTSSSIAGQVLDPSGKAIANAEVVATDVGRAVVRKTVTDSSGAYRLVGLAPATYAVSASAQGFANAVQEDLILAVDTQLGVDFHLSVAGTQQTVQVTATVRGIQTESAELGIVMDQHWIDTLPLDRRDFLQLALLVPGVLPAVEGSELSTRGSFAMHANGGREEYNNFLLDGVDNNDPYVNRYVVQPSVDSIQEFKTATNSYSAEYGRSGAGQVNVITRAGTNAFHGTLYEYLRNRVLDARNFFDGSDKPKFIRNQFGFGVGGPVIHSKTFFFASVDFLRERRGLSRLATVPTQAQRSGDLSGLAVVVVDPFTGQPFPANMIPSNRIDPVALQVLDLFPLPNRLGTSGNFLKDVVQREDQTQGNFRIDHHLTASDEITLRYSMGLVDLFEPYAEDTAATPGFGDFVNDHTHNAMVHYRRILGPRAVNSLRVGFNRFSRDLLPENFGVDVGQLWGVSWLAVPPRAFGYPVMNVAGFSRVGDAFGIPILRHANTFQVADSFSVDRGAHLLKAGGEVRHLQLNGTLDLLLRGSLSFSGFISGSGISDLLLGFPSFGLQATSDNPLTMRTTAYNLYFQDDWKALPTLTVNLGLRYEYNSPATDPTNRMSAFNLQTGQVVQVGTNGVTRSGLQPDRNNFAPRLGLAWTPGRNLVIRSGYGIYYDAGMFVVNSAQYFNPPQFNLRVFFPTSAGLLTLQDPFPSGGGFTPPPSLNTLSPAAVSTYVQHWNLTVQHNWGSLGTVSLGYAGSKGTKLIRARDLNQPSPGPGDPQLRRPFPTYGGIFFIETGAASDFHSLQAFFTRRVTSGLSLWATYTLSKSIDDASAFLDTKGDPNFPQDSQNLGAQRGVSSFDVRHRVALAYAYELPRRSRWTRNTEFRGITTIYSGQPFTPVLRFDNSNTGNNGGTTGYDRPNVLRDPHLSDPTPDRWFDTSAFEVPPQFTFGDAGRNILRGPGFASFDFSLVRYFAPWEGGRLTFEAQAFNLFNRANFVLPELFADEPTTFGKIFAAKPPRQVQFALRLSF